MHDDFDNTPHEFSLPTRREKVLAWGMLLAFIGVLVFIGAIVLHRSANAAALGPDAYGHPLASPDIRIDPLNDPRTTKTPFKVFATFCHHHAVDPDTGRTVPLCVEEIIHTYDSPTQYGDRDNPIDVTTTEEQQLEQCKLTAQANIAEWREHHSRYSSWTVDGWRCGKDYQLKGKL